MGRDVTGDGTTATFCGIASCAEYSELFKTVGLSETSCADAALVLTIIVIVVAVIFVGTIIGILLCCFLCKRCPVAQQRAKKRAVASPTGATATV